MELEQYTAGSKIHDTTGIGHERPRVMTELFTL